LNCKTDRGHTEIADTPIIIIQQQYLCEGGLSSVEKRVLLELTHNIKPHKIVVWQGAELSRQDILEQVYKTT